MTENQNLFSPENKSESTASENAKEETFIELDVKEDENLVSTPVTNETATIASEVRSTHINEKGHLVDQDGNKMFTTTEEALKDGSMKLDSQGRMPGIYLEDVERLEREDLEEKLNKMHEESAHTPEVFKEVNIRNSPLPPITVQTNPNLSQTQIDEVDRTSNPPSSESSQ